MRPLGLLRVGPGAILVAGLLLGPSATSVAADDPTLPNPAVYGNGPVATYAAPPMQPNSVGDDACSGEFPQAGWEMANENDGEFGARRLEGEVVIGHPPHGDAVINHHTEDYNFFVVPDNNNPLASYPTADYRYLLGEGNFQTGEPKERGRIEVENEYGALPWNDAGADGYFGIPPWVWPATGDRAIVEGYWIYDCGHHDPGYRSEIHPAWMVATIRNTMQSDIARGAARRGWVAPLGPDDASFSRVTKADIWISSFGGEAVEDILDELGPNGEDWWQPVNSRDYDFDIPLPPDKPSPDAQPVIQILDPPGTYWRPPGAVSPFFGGAQITPSAREGFLHVHVPFATVPTAKYMLFAKTIIVGWNVPAPEVQHLRITVNRWFVFEDMEDPDEAEYSPWAQSGDQNIFVRISDGDEADDPFNCYSDSNYMPYCEPDNEENSYVDNASIDRFINGHDPLIVQFRAKEEDIPDENDDAGFAMQAFTAGEDWGVGTHVVYQSDDTFAGEYIDFNGSQVPFQSQDNQCEDEGPDGHPDSCFAVTYTISRITDPTTTTTTAPAHQYAQDPNSFTAKVVTPGSPDKPRRLLPLTFTFTDGVHTQVLQGTTDDNGVAAPTDLLTLPAGTYTLTVAFAGNGLLTLSSDSDTVTIERDFTSTALQVEPKVRWGHQDPFTVTLIEPNDAPQAEGPLPIPGKNLTITLTGTLGTQTYPVGPTGTDGKATIAPLMTLPPGNYTAIACFAQDDWFLASCSTGQTLKVTFGFASFARGGPINFSGGSNKATGDLHSESSVLISGNKHVLSAGTGERFEYVTTFTDIGTGNAYNKFQVAPLGITPSYLRSTYCTGGATFMGVPITYSSKSVTFKNDQVISGIYCVTGDIKIQSRVSGTVVLLATGLITTSGGGENLATADPTGADVLLLAGSTDVKGVSIQATDSTFNGAIVSAGGVYISSKNSTFDTGLLGTQVLVSGSDNLLKAPQ
jgi:hypothetical protein